MIPTGLILVMPSVVFMYIDDDSNHFHSYYGWRQSVIRKFLFIFRMMSFHVICRLPLLLKARLFQRSYIFNNSYTLNFNNDN